MLARGYDFLRRDDTRHTVVNLVFRARYTHLMKALREDGVRVGRSVTQCSPTTGAVPVAGVLVSCASFSGAFVATSGSDIVTAGESQSPRSYVSPSCLVLSTVSSGSSKWLHEYEVRAVLRMLNQFSCSYTTAHTRSHYHEVMARREAERLTALAPGREIRYRGLGLFPLPGRRKGHSDFLVPRTNLRRRVASRLGKPKTPLDN